MRSLLLALTLPVSLMAQEGATLSGRILSEVDGGPIPAVSIVLESAGAADAIPGALTRPDGRFFVRGLTPGRYVVRASMPGFFPEQWDIVVSAINSAYDLGDLRLRPIGELDEVSVVVERTRAAGLTTQVFQMNDGAATTTGSVLDALRTLPGVTIDQDGAVSLRGSDQVAVLIDGRQSSLTGFGSQRGLDNIGASNIAAIEIIYNPSADLDASGMAGVINIIYEDERALGFSADAGLSLGLGQLGKQRPDLPTELGSFSRNPKVLPSLSLNYNTERVRTLLQGEFISQDALPNNEFTTRTYDDGRVIRSQVPENREQTHYILRLGTDLLAGGGNTVSISGVYDVEDHIDRAQVPFILAATGQRERYWFWTEDEQTGFANMSLNWNHAFPAPGHELDINLQYTRGWEDEAYFLNEESDVRVGTDMTLLEAVENTLPLSIDYTRPLASGRIQLGAKLQTRWLPITYTVDRGVGSVIYGGLGDASDWDEDLYAAYVNFVRAKPSYTIEAGLRAEQTNVAYTIPSENIYYPGSDAYDYFELFPNVKLTHLVGGSTQFVAAFNRRIDRPGEPELRIFPKYDDPELLKVGNPYLRPQLTNVGEVGFSRPWSGGSASMSAYRRDISDAVQRVFAIDASNPDYDIVNRIYENAANSTQTGIQAVLEHRFTPSLRLSGSVNWLVVDIDALETTLLFPTPRPFRVAASRDDTWDLTFNSQIQLPGQGDLRVGFVFYAARDVPQGRQRARSAVDIAATWPLMDDAADISFTLTDAFNDFAVRTDVVGDGFSALYENYLETQVVRMRMRVRF